MLATLCGKPFAVSNLKDSDSAEASADVKRQSLSCKACWVLVKRLVKGHTALGSHQASLSSIDTIFIITVVGISLCK